MNEITIITTYYNNKAHLENFIKKFIELRNFHPSFKLIVVDDGSMVYPAIDIFNRFSNNQNISLYRVTKDLGFNSHGARNLGMTVSMTDWNLLTDSDIDLSVYNIENFLEEKLNKNDIYSFTTNSILIHKEVFFSCKGYDEEFVNYHYGDIYFLGYLEKKYNFMQLKKHIDKLRRSWKVTMVDRNEVPYTLYDEENGTLIQPRLKGSWNTINLVIRRYELENFEKKKILNFEWEQLI